MAHFLKRLATLGSRYIWKRRQMHRTDGIMTLKYDSKIGIFNQKAYIRFAKLFTLI